MERVLLAHLTHINPMAAANAMYGKTVHVTAKFKNPFHELMVWGNELHLTFRDGKIAENNLREYAKNDRADEAAEYFLSPLHNLEDVDIVCEVEE